MKRVVLCLILCASANVAHGQGLLKALCCWRPFGGPYYGCHGGCDPNCMSGCMAGPNGCGERYWGDFFDPPPECCEPCDRLGNWAGRGPCYPPRPLMSLLFGIPYWPGQYAAGYDGGCYGGDECSGCTSCGGSYPGGDYADLGGYFTGPRPGCASCGQGGGGYSSEPMMEYSGPQGTPTPAAAPPAMTPSVPEGASSYYRAPRMPPKYHSAARKPSSRAPQSMPSPSRVGQQRTRSTLSPVQYQTPRRTPSSQYRTSSQDRR